MSAKEKGAPLGLLLRVQIRETLAKGDAALATEKEKKGKRKSGRGYTTMLVISVVLIVAVLSMYLVLLAFPLRAMNMLRLYPMIAVTGAGIFVLITSIYNTNGMLFGFKDYEMVSALPFTTRTVVACRFLLVYLGALAETAIFMVPVGVIYGIFAGPPIAFWFVYFLLMFVVPLLPCVIASLIGMAIGLVTSRARRPGTSKTILTVVLLVAWMFFCFSFSSIADEDAIERISAAMPQLMGVLSTVYPPATWFAQACCDFNMGSLVLFAGVSIGAFALFVWLVGRRYKAIDARLAPAPVKSKYRMGAMEGVSPRKALLAREWKRLTGSSTYFTNTCIGYILVLIFSAVMAFIPSVGSFLTQFEEMSAEYETGIVLHGPVMISVFLSMFMLISSPCIASVSLEGKSLWILKTIPVPPGEIVSAKLAVGVRIAAVTALISGALLWSTTPSMGLWGLTCVLMPLAYGLWGALFGMRLDLRNPTFDWATETQVVKRGRNSMIASFSGLGIGFVGFFLAMFLGDIVAILATAAVSVGDLVLYRGLRKNGAAQFEACGAA